MGRRGEMRHHEAPREQLESAETGHDKDKLGACAAAKPTSTNCKLLQVKPRDLHTSYMQGSLSSRRNVNNIYVGQINIFLV
jgi:hypothetical protein